jgi:hypothetical protein
MSHFLDRMTEPIIRIVSTLYRLITTYLPWGERMLAKTLPGFVCCIQNSQDYITFLYRRDNFSYALINEQIDLNLYASHVFNMFNEKLSIYMSIAIWFHLPTPWRLIELNATSKNHATGVMIIAFNHVVAINVFRHARFQLDTNCGDRSTFNSKRACLPIVHPFLR